MTLHLNCKFYTILNKLQSTVEFSSGQRKCTVYVNVKCTVYVNVKCTVYVNEQYYA